MAANTTHRALELTRPDWCRYLSGLVFSWLQNTFQTIVTVDIFVQLGQIEEIEIPVESLDNILQLWAGLRLLETLKPPKLHSDGSRRRGFMAP